MRIQVDRRKESVPAAFGQMIRFLNSFIATADNVFVPVLE